jgi:hypothetical protein
MFRVSHLYAWRLMLPFAQLVLSLATLWPVRHELTQQVQDAMKFSRLSEKRPPTIAEVVANVIPQRLTPEQKLEFKSFESRKWVPSVLNLPSGLIQLPCVILSPSKEEWVPVGLDLMTWRAISWPLLGLLFWWSAGRGIDALLAARQRLVRPRITWIETAIGIVLFLFCTIAAVCFPLFGYNDHDPDFPLKLFSCGFAMWALLAGVLIMAKFRQWKVLRS